MTKSSEAFLLQIPESVLEEEQTHGGSTFPDWCWRDRETKRWGGTGVTLQDYVELNTVWWRTKKCSFSRYQSFKFNKNHHRNLILDRPSTTRASMRKVMLVSAVVHCSCIACQNSSVQWICCATQTSTSWPLSVNQQEGNHVYCWNSWINNNYMFD